MNVTKQQAKEAFKVLEQYFKQQEEKTLNVFDWLKLTKASQNLVQAFTEIKMELDQAIKEATPTHKVTDFKDINKITDQFLFVWFGYSEVSEALTNEFIKLRMMYNEDGSVNNIYTQELDLRVKQAIERYTYLTTI